MAPALSSHGKSSTLKASLSKASSTKDISKNQPVSANKVTKSRAKSAAKRGVSKTQNKALAIEKTISAALSENGSSFARNTDDDKVKQLILEALRTIRSDHFDDYFDLFTDDAVWMMPSSQEDVFIEEAKKFYGFTKNFWFDQETVIDELVVYGDFAYVRVSFDGFLRPKHDDCSKPLKSVSRHIWILQKQLDNSWKISRDIWNNPK